MKCYICEVPKLGLPLPKICTAQDITLKTRLRVLMMCKDVNQQRRNPQLLQKYRWSITFPDWVTQTLDPKGLYKYSCPQGDNG